MRFHTGMEINSTHLKVISFRTAQLAEVLNLNFYILSLARA